MTDQEIITAFKPLGYFGETVSTVAGMIDAKGIECIFRGTLERGSCSFYRLAQDVWDLREAVMPLGNPKVSALLNEMVNLSHRMTQVEAELPPSPLRDRELHLAGMSFFTAFNVLWSYLLTVVFSVTYVDPGVPDDVRDGVEGDPGPKYKKWIERVENCHHWVVTRPGHAPLRVNYNGRPVPLALLRERFMETIGETNEDDIGTIIEKVTQYLSTLCK